MLIMRHTLRGPRYVPPAVGTYTGARRAWVTRTLTYQPIGTGSGGPQSQYCAVWTPNEYDNSVPFSLTVYAGGSGTRHGTGALDNNNTSQLTEVGNLPALITATPSWWTNTIVVAMQCPLLPGSGSRLSFYGMPKACIDMISSEWNIDPLRRYFMSFSQGGLFMMEGMIAPQNQTLFAGFAIAAGEVFGTSSTGTWLLDPTLDTNVKAANAVGIALGNTAMWQYNGEHPPGSGTDGAVGFAQAKELRDGIRAAGNTNYALVGSPTVPGFVDTTDSDHQAVGQNMFGSGALGISYSTLHSYHR